MALVPLACGSPQTDAQDPAEIDGIFETNCSDGIDNDEDGQADCADVDCDDCYEVPLSAGGLYAAP